MEDKRIYVTRPWLPPIEEFNHYLEKIWENKILTNGGPFHQELEKRLCEYFDVPYISLFSNGTLALLTALQAFGISGEVITTPFSFVATSHVLLWNNITPVFIDIEPDTFTLDPTKIEAAITSKTSAILPVHVYGNRCNADEIKRIALKHNLKVIYDAAHTFGSRYKGKSLCRFGDLSVLSFHATKVFNTFEGGAIICHDSQMKEHIDHLKNFGFIDEVTVTEPGINAKMNEFQAALGLLQLKYIDEAIQKRKKLSEQYSLGLMNVPGVSSMKQDEGMESNYSYFPVIINDKLYGRTRDELYERMRRDHIFPRRYFYPLISQFPMYRHLPSARPENLQVATSISSSVLCLPIYPDLEPVTVDRIIKLIMDFSSQG